MNNFPRVIDLVVKNDLCVGCGICVYKCPSNALEMSWDSKGFLLPKVVSTCDSDGDCLDVCPFNPIPKDEVKTENEIAELFLETENHHQKIGKYNQIYAGFSTEFRLSSSSGGLGTYLSVKLLEKKIVDHIFSIKESSTPGTYYEYAVSSTKDDLLRASKTRYFPVTMASVFSEIDKLEGTVAIVGVGCFIKAIRLAQHGDPTLKEKIPFLIGIICGGLKSSFFTEYLASKMDVEAVNIHKPQFRKKDIESTANDYSFSCSDENEEEKSIKMKTVGDMWGTGFFKANACDFCDDVTTELADISLGDAWLDPFDKDGKGTNVMVSRSSLAEKLIKEGIENEDLEVDFLPLEIFLSSQQGSFNHRHKGLPTRIKVAKKKNQLVPPKRFETEMVSLDFELVQKQRMKVRAESLALWQNRKEASIFDESMQKPLKKLNFHTRIYHKRRAFLQFKNKVIVKIGSFILSKNKNK